MPSHLDDAEDPHHRVKEYLEALSQAESDTQTDHQPIIPSGLNARPTSPVSQVKVTSAPSHPFRFPDSVQPTGGLPSTSTTTVFSVSRPRMSVHVGNPVNVSSFRQTGPSIGAMLSSKWLVRRCRLR